MLLFLFGVANSIIIVQAVGTVVTVSGDGPIYQSDIRSISDYTQFTEVVINNGPSELKSDSLKDLSSLQILHISKSVQIKDGGVFYSNRALKKFIVDTENPYLWTDGDFLYSFDKTILIKSVCNPDISLLRNVQKVLSLAFDCVKTSILTVPSSIESILNNAFRSSTMTELRWEEGSRLTELSTYIFNWAYITTVHIPPSVRIITTGSFNELHCSSLIFDDIENSNCSILHTYSFSNVRIHNITLPPRISSLPENCFRNSDIRRINIPLFCSSISEAAFPGCTDLESVTVDQGNQNFTTFGSTVYSADLKQIVFIPPSSKNVSISKDVEKIATSLLLSLTGVSEIFVDPLSDHFAGLDGCLYNKTFTELICICGGVNALRVHKDTTKILKYACMGVSIKSIEFLGDEVISIGEYAFSECKGITQVEFPSKLKYLYQSSFSQASSLERISFRNISSITHIYDYAFSSTSIKELFIPKQLTILRGSSFSDITSCRKITFEEGSNLETILECSFRSLGRYSDSNFTATIPKSVKIIEQSAFENCVFNFEFEEGGLDLKIDVLAFSGTRIKGELKMPDRIVKLTGGTFSKCPLLTSVVFSSNSRIQSITGTVFGQDPNLTSMIIPTSLGSFDSGIFTECYSLTELRGINPSPSMNKEIKLTISGNIVYSHDMSILFACAPGVQKAYVNTNVERIGSNAFYKCIKLEHVEFNDPSRLTTLGENVFSGCSKLGSVLLPELIQTISKGCFEDCSNLQSVQLRTGSKLQTIGPSSFLGCPRLSNFDFEKCASLNTIGDKAFAGSQIKQLHINNVETLGSESFRGCANLASIKINSFSVDGKIGEWAFADCVGLSNFSIPIGLKALGKGSLSNTSIESISVPLGISRLCESSLAHCSKLAYVNLSSSVEFIEESVFEDCPCLVYIIFCGTIIIGESCGLQQETNFAIYTSHKYESKSFCGIKVSMQLQNNCQFIPQTATGSAMFTSLSGCSVCGGIGCSLVLFGSTDDDGTNPSEMVEKIQ